MPSEIIVVSKNRGLMLEVSSHTMPKFTWVNLVFDEEQNLVEVVSADKIVTRVLFDPAAVKTKRQTKDGLRADLRERIVKVAQELESLRLEEKQLFDNQ